LPYMAFVSERRDDARVADDGVHVGPKICNQAVDSNRQ
jgi:hypothetical protein